MRLKQLASSPLFHQTENIVTDLLRYCSEGPEPKQRPNSHCRVCIYHDRCASDAQHIDHLSQLQGISGSEIEKLNAKGIFTVHQLSHTFRPRKRPKRQGEREYIPYHHSLKALAVRENKIHVFQRPPAVSATTRLYLDMEGGHAARHIFLIGLLIVRDGRQTYTSFWADGQDDEERIFQALFDRLAGLDLEHSHLFHYGSYDGRALKRMLHLASTDGVAELVTTKTTNVLRTIYAQVYFPTYGNRLKDDAAFLGFKWTYPHYSGMEAVLWRHLWELSHSAQIRTLLTKYNRDDCMALRLVHEAVEKIAEGSSTEHVNCLAPPKSQDPEGEAAVCTDSLMHTSDYKEWGQRAFAREEFRRVADCAYFEYQRNRIYVRTNAQVRLYQSRSKKRSQRATVRPNTIVEQRVRMCPRCKSKTLVLDYHAGKEKFAYDLRFCAVESADG